MVLGFPKIGKIYFCHKSSARVYLGVFGVVDHNKHDFKRLEPFSMTQNSKLNELVGVLSVVSKNGNATSDRKSDLRFGFLGSNLP